MERTSVYINDRLSALLYSCGLIFLHCDFITSLIFVARPSLSHSSDLESTSTGRHSGLLPKFAISAEAESCESSLSLEKSAKVSFSVGELPQDEPDATTPSSPVSNATLSGTAFIARQIYCNVSGLIIPKQWCEFSLLQVSNSGNSK